MQLGIAILVMRIFFIVLKPLRQPRFVAEVAASIFFRPTIIGFFNVPELGCKIFTTLYPFENSMLLESFSTLGLTYYLFLDVVLAPLGALFWAVTLTMTSFLDLAKIISDFKLLHTEVGKISLSSTIINDISTWFLFNGTIITSNGIGYKVAIMTIPYIAFVVICVFVLRPSIGWFINCSKKKGGKYSDTHVYFILIGVVIFGCVADACGLHSLVGGYIFGLIIPRGELAINVMERSEKFVTGIMLSSFLICSGLRTQFDYKEIQANWETLICIITFATSAKIVSTSIVPLCCCMSLRDSLTLGGLMNTKGFLALIVLNEDRSMLRPTQNKLRTIQGSSPDEELRVLTCIHSIPNIPGIINLLQVSNFTQRSPISVFAVHLVKLTRAAPLLIVHNTPDNNSGRGNRKLDHTITAFKDYKDMNEAVSVYPLTAVSPYPTMHEDIFRLAEDKDVTIILIPFHKQVTVDGELQDDHHPIRDVYRNLLEKAPCCVGILVDRGLAFHISSNVSSGRREHRVAVIFIGGPED
ncbi:hypothetical protein Patl1_02002 [Pistacia atlantica]|uniref:Uncharacterized protein n=1 Tax=Pistacia atlantica TaxID=434234 RepID=A0ACC1CAC9_9ROSI|nr:hypothetical protein Patl1_02002 [Pistacia atlantica]